MKNKITKIILERIQLLCYDKLLIEIIDKESLDLAKKITETFLKDNEYDIDNVKCDWENNPCTIIDSGKIIIEIVENTNIPHEKIIHTITL